MHALVLALLFAAAPVPEAAPAPEPARSPTPAGSPASAEGPPPVSVSMTLAPDPNAPAATAPADANALAHDPARPLEVMLGEPLVLTLEAQGRARHHALSAAHAGARRLRGRPRARRHRRRPKAPTRS